MPELRENARGNRGLPRTVREIAVEQHGVVARRQLLERGIREDAIDRAIAAERLIVVHDGVYTTTAPELVSAEGALTAARLAVGACTALGFGTSAWRWKLVAAPPRIPILVTTHEHVSPPGVEVRRVRLREGEVVDCGGIPTTSVLRTLLDIAISWSMTSLLRAMAEAEFLYDVRPHHYDDVFRRGHRGSGRLRRARELHVPGYGQAKSKLERRFRRLLIEAGIGLPLRNAQVGPYLVDCLWPDLRLVVELDGGQHERAHQAAVDAERDLWLRSNGYVVIRYSWRQVFERPALVIADLKQTIRELCEITRGNRG